MKKKGKGSIAECGNCKIMEGMHGQPVRQLIQSIKNSNNNSNYRYCISIMDIDSMDNIAAINTHIIFFYFFLLFVGSERKTRRGPRN